MLTCLPPAIYHHPPSDKLLYHAISKLEPTHKQALVDATKLSPATVYRALERLEAAGVVERASDGDDLRQARVATSSGA